jgi:uncharacterized membrane protein
MIWGKRTIVNFLDVGLSLHLEAEMRKPMENSITKIGIVAEIRTGDL